MIQSQFYQKHFSRIIIKEYTLTISFSSFNVISDDTFNSCDPFKFRLVLDGLVFSIFGLLAATCDRIKKSIWTSGNRARHFEHLFSGSRRPDAVSMLDTSNERRRKIKQRADEQRDEAAGHKVVET